MRKYSGCFLAAFITLILLFIPCEVFAETWEYGTYGEGKNPFTPRGYVVETENGWFWLSSRIDNSTEDTIYTGIKNGVDYIPAVRSDGLNYRFLAFTDRNPRFYKYLFAYKNGEKIENLLDYVQAPGRLQEYETLGSGAGWAIPIEGFVLEPGCYYEFGFQRGLQANNGITLVFADDGKGYIRNPVTEAEIAKYNHDQYEEFEFMASYWVVYDEEKKDYVYDFHLVPMRFAVQTYADLTMWQIGRQAAVDFLAGVTEADYEKGIFVRSNVENLQTVLAALDAEAETGVKLMLQDKAEQTMDLMLGELEIALKRGIQPVLEGADLTELSKLIKEGRVLHAEASKKIGSAIGQYGEAQTQSLSAALEYAKTMTATNTQAEVNAAADNLAEAITRVYASVIREESLILFDDATKIKLIVPTAAVPGDTVLYVERFSKTDENFLHVLDLLGGNIGADRLLLYDIKLYSLELRTEPTKKYSAQIPVLASQRKADMYYIDENMQLTRITSSYADSYKIFSSKNTGLFAVVMPEDALLEAEQQPPEPEPEPDPEPPALEPEPEPQPETQPQTEPEDTSETEPDAENPPDDKISIVETTDDEIKEEEDNSKQEVEQTEGEIYIPEEINEEDIRKTTGPELPIVIPLASMIREKNNSIMPIVAILLLLAAVYLLVSSLFRRWRQ